MKGKKKLATTLALAMIVSLGACTKNGVTAPHPGSVNAFDSNSYDVLMVSKATIDQTKTDLAAGQFGNITANVKTALNDCIQAYNVADVAYTAYHTAAVASLTSAATTQAQATLNTALANLNTATNTLTSVKTGS